MKNIIGSSFISACLHGILLACCLAAPAQKIIPLFQAGNSALTLTSLSISVPAKNTLQTDRQAVDREAGPEFAAESDAEPESALEGDPDDFPAIPAEKLAATSTSKPQNQEMLVDADASLKGVSGFMAESAGICPYYPLGARMRGEEGVVKVDVSVGVKGQVLDCALAKSSGFSALDNAALKAVKCAHYISISFLPIQKNSKTVLTFRFDLVD